MLFGFCYSNSGSEPEMGESPDIISDMDYSKFDNLDQVSFIINTCLLGKVENGLQFEKLEYWTFF